MLNTRFFLSLGFSLVFFNTLYADNRWVAPEKDSLGVRLGILSPVLFLDLKDSKNSGAATPLKYQPNSGSRTALTLFYSQFSLTGSVPNNLDEKIIQDKGTSRVEDYQFRFYHKYGTWDFFYQKYQGYFIDNSSDVDPTYTGSARLKRPDLKTSHVGIQYFYIPYPENYSLGGTFDQNIRQIASGGSLFYSGYIGEHSIGAQSPLVPAALAAPYGSLANFKEGHFQNIRAGIGYGYTAVIYKFYLGFIAGVSLGQQQQKFDLVTESFDRWVPSNGSNLRVGLGYNGEKYFSGIQYIMDNTAIPFNEYMLGLTTGEYKLFFGSRFEGVKIPPITELGDWLNGD